MSQPQVAIARKESSEETLARGRRRKDKKVPGAIPDSSSGSTICDDETILRELCVVNGINYDKLHHGSGSKVKRLEIFFFGCPHIPEGLDQFPNLLSLCIVNQRFHCISGLEGCPLLEELWICETQVKKIEGLNNCQNLVKLHLYSNQIKKIEGLEGLSRLEKLWLNGNDISSLEGLEELKGLKDLNLAANKITIIGKSLSHLSQLETLNLSGNMISSLVELVHLSSLPKLRCLSLCHPMHSPNPVCCLCNYSTHTLFHFPRLRWLDGREVASQDLQKLVQGLVLRKIQYYRMKTHHCRMECSCRISELQERLKGHLHHCHLKLRALSKFQKNCLGSSSAAAAVEQVSRLLSCITDHIDKATDICSESCQAIETEMDQKCEFWMMELNSGGNVKLTCCEPAQPCYNSCSELIHSRFSVADAENFGVGGLEVTQVVRVENRLLFNGFNDKLKSLLEMEPYSSMTTNQIYKKMVDYLFLVWHGDGDTSVSSICQNGFASSPEGIWLTNSVNIADQQRLQKKAQYAKQGRSVDNPQALLLCKVFIGQAVETTSLECPTQTAFPGASSVFRTHGVAQQGTITDLYSKDWFVFDSSLVLPEYIIQFKYLSPHCCEDPLELYISTHCLPTDEDIHSVVSHTPSSTGPRLAMLDEPTLLELTGQSTLASIHEVNLCNNRLTRFRLASSLVQLTSLILSGNELSTAEDFSNLPNLELLDLSFNKLCNLQGLKSLSKLKSLDISWNFLSSYHDDLSPLRKQCPALQTLDTRHNPWRIKDHLRTFILGRMRSLQTIDGQAVTEEEASKAIRNVVASHLTVSTLLSHAHTDVAPLPTLSVSPIAQTLHRHPPRASLHLTSAPSTEWYHKVSAVCLSNLGLCKLAHLDQLPNLRWLSLANNTLSSLEGLLQCTSLEELTLDNNLLTSVDGIGNLVSLRWLSASCNQLTKLSSTLCNLSKLHYLNLSQNKLTSLQELKLVSLMELYVSANALSSLRELFCLKSLSFLVVLDLSLNPLTSLHTYRPFVVFHLTFLKALDGRAIVLTQDFVFQKYPNLLFKDMLKLDLPNCGIKHVDLSPVQSFINLASLNLENNSLTSFSGLVLLNQLKVLCLNHNRIEQLVTDAGTASQLGCDSVLTSLQVLHLAYNGISNMLSLQLNRIPSLRALFLQGNEISKIEGLNHLHNLTELVLDRNKIKCLQEHSFAGLDCLRELHLEENRLRDLSHFKPLPSLERLYLGLNRIQDYNQLEKLHSLYNLVELSVMGNSVSRRLQHRVLLIYQHPALTALDGVAVSAVERQAAEMVFGGEQQECELTPDASLLPGLSGAAPLRVMNVPFSRNQHLRQVTDARTIQGHVQNVQGFHDKKKRKN